MVVSKGELGKSLSQNSLDLLAWKWAGMISSEGVTICPNFMQRGNK